jgi:hypothetical protein
MDSHADVVLSQIEGDALWGGEGHEAHSST